MGLHLPLHSETSSVTVLCQALPLAAKGTSVQAGCSNRTIVPLRPMRGTQGALAGSLRLPSVPAAAHRLRRSLSSSFTVSCKVVKLVAHMRRSCAERPPERLDQCMDLIARRVFSIGNAYRVADVLAVEAIHDHNVIALRKNGIDRFVPANVNGIT